MNFRNLSICFVFGFECLQYGSIWAGICDLARKKKGKKKKKHIAAF